MTLTKQGAFTKKVTDLPNTPSPSYSAADIKSYFQTPADELASTLNKLADDLMASTAAGNVGASSVSGLTGPSVQALIESLKNYVDFHKSDKNNPHGVTAAQINAYTKEELAPFLQGGDTLILEEVFTIVNSNNGNGTFTYKDSNNTQFTGTLTAEGYQVFDFKKGVYDLGLNRVECIVGDTLRRSVISGGLQEKTNTSVALTIPEGNGAEITFKYFQRIGITGEHNLVIGDNQPPVSGGNTVWMKVVG